MSHRPLFLTMILYTIQNVISLNCLFNYIFFTKLFFCVSENQECNVGLFKQVFPVGIAEVNFLSYFANTTKKQKESPHSFFNECELSIFWYKKRASKWLRYTKLILLLTTQFYHIFIQKSMHFINKIKIYLKFMRFQQGITSVFGYNVQTDWRKISTI